MIFKLINTFVQPALPVDENQIFELAIRAEAMSDSMLRLPLIEKVKLISDLCGLIANDYGCSITHSSQMAVEVECFLNENISKFSTGVRSVNLDSLDLN